MGTAVNSHISLATPGLRCLKKKKMSVSARKCISDECAISLDALSMLWWWCRMAESLCNVSVVTPRALKWLAWGLFLLPAAISQCHVVHSAQRMAFLVSLAGAEWWVCMGYVHSSGTRCSPVHARECSLHHAGIAEQSLVWMWRAKIFCLINKTVLILFLHYVKLQHSY